MIFHYAKKIATISLLLLPLSSCGTPIESHLTCNPLASKVPLIVQLAKSLKKTSKEYIVHYQNNSSGWTFESYLFVGEVNGKYIITSAGSEISKSELITSKSYFYELRNAVREGIKDKGNTQSSKQDYCQYISVSGQESVILAEANSDSKLRKLRRKLDALIIYRNE